VTDAGLSRAGASGEATTDRARDAAPVPVLIGGVSELFQGDLDLGRLVVERLQGEELGSGVFVEELHYGGVAVAQRLEDLRPQVLLLVSSVVRDRPPGTVERRRLTPPQLDAVTVQLAVGDAVTGYVHPDLVIEIATAFGVLPQRIVAFEVEPELVAPGEGLSKTVSVALEDVLDLLRTEAARCPLLSLAAELRPLVAGARLEGDRLDGDPGDGDTLDALLAGTWNASVPGVSVALQAVRDLLDELVLLDEHGHWGRTFALRDRLRLGIAGAHSSEGMDHRDWALWWALVEELDRLEAREALQG